MSSNVREDVPFTKDEIEKAAKSIGFEFHGQDGNAVSLKRGRHHVLAYDGKFRMHKDVPRFGGFGRREHHKAVDPDEEIVKELKDELGA